LKIWSAPGRGTLAVARGGIATAEVPESDRQVPTPGTPGTPESRLFTSISVFGILIYVIVHWAII